MKRPAGGLFSLLVFLLIIGLSWSGWLDSYSQLVVMFIGVNIILSASLNLINGYMGEFSCGHAGFMAVGAYCSSLLSVWLFTENSPWGLHSAVPPVGHCPFLLLTALAERPPPWPASWWPSPSFRTRGRLSGHYHPGGQLHY